MAETSPRSLTPSISSGAALTMLLAGVAIYSAGFAYAMSRWSYDIWGAVWLAPALIMISVPVLLRYAKSHPAPGIGPLLVAAMLLKLAASVPRYYMVVVLYGTGDSIRYSETATRLRAAFLQQDFSLAALGSDRRTGTQFVEIVSGIVYTAIGPSFLGGFLFFSWLSFWGLFFFFRAFRVAIPDGDPKRYGILLFLLPSMLFWPSSIGKEAWMTLVLGLTAYGCALLLSRRRGASVYLVLGVAGVLAVRPHVALLVVAGLALGYLLRSQGARRVVALGRLRTAVGLAVIGAGTLVVVRQVATFFGLDELSVDTAVNTLEYAEGQTETGGSEFSGTGPSLHNLPMNLLTVLFRPFAFEVHNAQALLSALEGTVLMVVFVLAWPRLRTIPGRLRKNPYVTFCLTYILLFCFIFSAFQNFGILVRERVMVFPFVLALLALPPRSSAKSSANRPQQQQQVEAPPYPAATLR